MTTTPPRRIARDPLLAATVALALLAAWSIRSTPAVLTWALLPYLGLVARRLLGPTTVGEPIGDRPDEAPPVEARRPEPEPPRPEPEPEAPAPTRPVPSRPRRRPRAASTAEVRPAAWVEVAPGRFVRGEFPEPAPDAEGAGAEGPATPEAPAEAGPVAAVPPAESPGGI